VCTRTSDGRGCHRPDGCTCRSGASAGRTPGTNSAGRHPLRAGPVRGAAKIPCTRTSNGRDCHRPGGGTCRSAASAGRTPCTNSTGRHRDRAGAGPVRSAAKTPCTRASDRRGCHQPGSAACRSGASLGRTPCTNSAGRHPHRSDGAQPKAHAPIPPAPAWIALDQAPASVGADQAAKPLAPERIERGPCSAPAPVRCTAQPKAHATERSPRPGSSSRTIPVGRAAHRWLRQQKLMHQKPA